MELQKRKNVEHLFFSSDIIEFLYLKTVPLLQEKLNKCTDGAEVQEQGKVDRYKLSDIFPSDEDI